MTLNELLARCNFEDVRERAMLLDELHQAGRLEEEELLAQAGIEVTWEDGCLLAPFGSLERRNDGYSCPYCGVHYRGDREAPAWCPHMVIGLYRGESTLHPAFHTLHPDLLDTIHDRFLASPPYRSPVVPVQIHAGARARVFARDYYVDFGPEGPFFLAEEGTTVAFICAPDPEAYVGRLVNLVRQRAAAGCFIQVAGVEV